MHWIERHRRLMDYTLSSLFRRKGRHLMLLATYTIVIFIPASAVFFAAALQDEANALLDGAPDITIQRIIAGRQVFVPVDYADRLHAIRGIRSARTRLWAYYVNPVNGSRYTIMVPPDFSYADDEIVVGEGVMRTWDAIEGRRLFFTAHDRSGILLNVVTTLETDTGLVSSDLILMSESSFRRVSGLPPGFAADIVVTVRNIREVPTIAAKITHILPETVPILKTDLLQTYQAAFDRRSGIAVVLFFGTLLAFLVFAGDRALAMSGEEIYEIGVLKALGWDTSDILSMKFWESAVMSLTAFTAGIVSAYLHTFQMSAPLFAGILKGWSVLYPRFDLPPKIDAGDVSLLFLMSVVPYTLATVIPAWRTATLPPDEALRSR
ncbi:MULTISPECIES: ABC transporter permease [Desulfococcus]|nr:FtsX-like permease family protein [Desulfococcus multivorans]AOY59307.1 putative ABC transporter, permease protein [Desulfococcus multivorans]